MIVCIGTAFSVINYKNYISNKFIYLLRKIYIYGQFKVTFLLKYFLNINYDPCSKIKCNEVLTLKISCTY